MEKKQILQGPASIVRVDQMDASNFSIYFNYSFVFGNSCNDSNNYYNNNNNKNF